MSKRKFSFDDVCNITNMPMAVSVIHKYSKKYKFEHDNPILSYENKDKHKIILSTFLLSGICKTFEYFDYTKSYILGLGYTRNDVQFAITGTEQLNETTHQAIIRELEEEVGITIDETKLTNKIIKETPLRRNSTYLLHASHAKPYNGYADMFVQNRDDKFRKVQVVIYGSLKEITKLIEMITRRRPSEEQHSIVSLHILEAKTIYRNLCDHKIFRGRN